MRNLSVLERLVLGKATLEELSESAKCREGDLSSSLRILKQQGLVSQSGNTYELVDRATEILSLVNPWISYFNGQFYDIAKDTAKAIHEKSWDQVGVVDVMLYGSTLRTDTPRDIDLLIIHNGNELSPYSPYGKLRVDEPVGDENARDSAWSIFHQLGYKSEKSKTDNVALAVGKRIAGLNAGTVTEEKIAKETEFWKHLYDEEKETFELAARVDIYGIDNVFDVIVLDVGALKADVNDQIQCEHYKIEGLRKRAVESCRDPTFWHTILSEGRIYDRAKHDFSLTVEDRYPGAVDLFPSK